MRTWRWFAARMAWLPPKSPYVLTVQSERDNKPLTGVAAQDAMRAWATA